MERCNNQVILKMHMTATLTKAAWQVAKGRRNPLLEGREGKDLLLLLDLASHSLGLVPALQVLALLDEGFQRLCQPKLMKFQVLIEITVSLYFFPRDDQDHPFPPS